MSAAQEIVTHQEAPPPAQIVNQGDALLSMIERAARDPAVNVDKMERLFSMHAEMQARHARSAFNAAVAAAKGEIKPIARNATGHNDKRYADFSAVARAVDPVLAKHGLSYRFRTSQADRIQVTCILAHQDGHSEESTLTGPPDKSGSKNDIQAIGSTLSYLQRYSLVQALGLSVARDDDGQAAGDSDPETLRAEGERIAREEGMIALGQWWTKTISSADRKALGTDALTQLKKIAEGAQ